MKYESDILKRLIDTYGVVGNPQYMSEIIKEFIVQGKECFPNLFTYQSDWLAHIDEFGLKPTYTVSYTGQSFYAPNTLEKPIKSAILKGQTIKRYKDNLFDGIIESGGLGINSGENDDRYPNRGRSVNFIKVEPNSTITFVRNLGTNGFHVVGYNENKEFVKGFADVMKANVLVGKINTTSDIYYVKFYDVEPTSESEFGVFQGDVEPTYELVSVKTPVLTTSNEDGTKTNILSCNEEVELRGIGNVKDELDLLTGEVVQSVGVLNGEETGWKQEYATQAPTDSSLIAFSIDLIKSPNKNLLSSVLEKSSDVNKPYRWYITFNTWLVITLPKSEVANLDEFKAWLKNNEVVYPLTEKSNKTVDLSILDQNGQNVKQLMSFNGGTHFTTSSQDGSLLPTLTVDVVTDLEKTMMVCSLEGNTM